MAEFIAKEPFSGTSSITVTFPEVRHSLVITNEGSASLQFTLNGRTYTLGQNVAFDEETDPFTQLSVNATGTFYGYARQRK